jgi:PAS domain S-box-containing protein
MDEEIRILHVEDLSSDAMLAEREIGKVLKKYSIRVVETKADFISELKVFQPNIVISDYKLPCFNGLSALLISLEMSPLTPVIILTGSMNEDTAVDCIKSGATDYVIKEHIKRLGPAVVNALEQKEIKVNKIKAETALRESEERYRTIVSNIPGGLIHIFDRELRYVFNAGEELTRLGLSNEFLVGKSIYDILTADIASMVETQYRKVLLGETVRFEGPYGEDYYSVTSAPLRGTNGEIEYILTLSINITERKQTEKELIKAKDKAEESDRLKTAFLHNISHEIRTPMNAIVGFSGFLNEPGLLPEKCKKFTDIIVQSSNQLLSIITDIISIATIESGQEKILETKINLNSTLKLLHEQFFLKAKRQNISLNMEYFLPDSEVNIVSDETKLVQVLTNLIGNAIKFTKQGYVSFGYNLKNNEFEFYVEDTGIGIPSEMHQEIFKRFRQVESCMAREFGGSGLGLSISKAYIELLGGKMWLTSELNKGSIFYFTIPYKKTPSDKHFFTQPAEVPSIEHKKAKTILVAEDEDYNFMLVEELLDTTNITIIRASNGIEAVEICKLNQQIDLVLMDLKMPVMDGYEATRRIREFMPALPIIAQTAYTTENDKNKAIACGCNDFISKPFNRELLLSKINEQMNNLTIN